ncbi:MAG: hypothetical protein ACRYGK_01015 [Janthinobacterium lividum]
MAAKTRYESENHTGEDVPNPAYGQRRSGGSSVYSAADDYYSSRESRTIRRINPALAKPLAQFNGWNALLTPLRHLLVQHFQGAPRETVQALADALQQIEVEQKAYSAVEALLPMINMRRDLGNAAVALNLQSHALSVDKNRLQAPSTQTTQNSQDKGELPEREKNLQAKFDGLLKVALREDLHSSTRKVHDLLADGGFRRNLEGTIETALTRLVRRRPGDHISFALTSALKTAVANVLENRMLSAVFMRKSNAIQDALLTHASTLGRASREAMLNAMLAIDPDQIRKESVMNTFSLGTNPACWDEIGEAVMALVKQWGNGKPHFDAEALKTHQVHSAQALATANLLRNTAAFEPYVSAVFPFLSIANIREMLADIKRKKLVCSSEFQTSLRAMAAYFDWMNNLGMVDEEDEHGPLKLYLSSTSASSATFLQIADLLVLNPKNQNKETLLDNFQIIKLTRDEVTSNGVTLPLLRQLVLPTHLKTALTTGFTIGAVVADVLVGALKKLVDLRQLEISEEEQKFYNTPSMKSSHGPRTGFKLP